MILRDNTFRTDDSNRIVGQFDTPSDALINNPAFFTASGHVSKQDRDDVVVAGTYPCSIDAAKINALTSASCLAQTPKFCNLGGWPSLPVSRAHLLSL